MRIACIDLYCQMAYSYKSYPYCPMNLAIVSLTPFVALAAVCALVAFIVTVITFVQLLYDVKHPECRAERFFHVGWYLSCLGVLAIVLGHAYDTITRDTLLMYLGFVFFFLLFALGVISKIDQWAHKTDIWLETHSIVSR